jgi:hypothetical protein
MGSGKKAERAGGEPGRIGLTGRRAMAAQEREVHVDGEGMITFGADRRG